MTNVPRPNDWLRRGRIGQKVMMALALSLYACDGTQGAVAEKDEKLLRFGLSSQAFSGLNENDARAALKVWTKTIVEERKIPVDTQPLALKGVAAEIEALQSNQVDFLVLTAEEYLAVNRQVPLERTFFGATQQGIAVEYILAIRADRSLPEVAQLRQGKLVTVENTHMSLARYWLDCLLLEQGLAESSQFFGSIESKIKPSAAVLALFFNSADACLVTRSGLQTMTELNPQVGRRLRVIAASPPVVPIVLCFRAGSHSPHRDNSIAALLELHQKPAGRQILTVFQFDRIVEHPASVLDSTRSLMDSYDRWRTRRDGNSPPAEAVAEKRGQKLP